MKDPDGNLLSGSSEPEPCSGLTRQSLPSTLRLPVLRPKDRAARGDFGRIWSPTDALSKVPLVRPWGLWSNWSPKGALRPKFPLTGLWDIRSPTDAGTDRVAGGLTSGHPPTRHVQSPTARPPAKTRSHPVTVRARPTGPNAILIRAGSGSPLRPAAHRGAPHGSPAVPTILRTSPWRAEPVPAPAADRPGSHGPCERNCP